MKLRRKSNDGDPNPDASESRHNSSNAGGYLKIFFFYHQMAHVISGSIPSDYNLMFVSKFKSSISQVINMIIVNLSFHDCPFKNLHPVSKTVFLHSLGLWLLLLIFVVYLLYILVKWTRKRQGRKNMTPSSLQESSEYQNPENHFLVRIGCAFTYVCLLMYSSSAELSLSLLNCIEVGKDRVLFIDGTVKCYQPYQYFVMAYIVFSVLPFCFVPVFGCYLLFLKQISPAQLFLGCLLPLPYCCYWCYKLIRYCRGPTAISNTMEYSMEDENRQALIRILSGPFRTHNRFYCLSNSKLPWEGALILCRLIIILSLTLSSDNRVRSLVLMVICLSMLVSHIYIRPFQSVHQNLIATLSLFSIVIICALSLLKAMYHGEDCSSLSESKFLLKASDIAINALVVIPAAVLAILVFTVLFVELVHKIIIILKRAKISIQYIIRMQNIINI